MEEINLYNLYDYVTYMFDEDILNIYWDPINKSVDDLMMLERRMFLLDYKSQYKCSCFWVDELKKCVSWEHGKKIYMKCVSFRNGLIQVFIYGRDIQMFGTEMIDENGYLFIRNNECFDGGRNILLKRCDCVYNDIINEDQLPYILK